MNYPLLRYLFGMVLMIVAAFLVLPLAVAVIYGESSGIYFLYTMIAAGLLGFLLTRFKPAKRDMYAREGFVFTALAWVVISLIGAAPFTLSGQIPSYLDAVFETVSGFTTTGASILTDVEALDNGMLFWRSFTHWLGGMGILVFMLSLVNMGGQANHLLRAESPGPTVSKMVPNMRKSAAILYGIYIVMTAVEVVLLLLGGMPLFDSLCTAFGTAGTGGFGIKNSSMGYYNSYYLQGVVSVFMALFGVNFNVYFFLLMKKYAMAWRNTEVRAYFAIIAGSTLIITLNILGMFPTAFDAFHHAFFAVSSVITTTGFSTTDFDLWPQLSRCILVLLMIVGACAGSTGGGVKVSRLVILCKALGSELRKLLHPRSVRVLTVDGKPVNRETVQGVQSYMTLYFLVTLVSVLLVALDNLDFVTTFTAVLATLNNIGPGLGLVGPTGCGKTTLINLLLRFYDIDAGRIAVDGKASRDYTRSSLRRAFGMVLQDTWLFEGTVADNIAYGCPGATREQVIEAAKRAHAHKFIVQLPGGYDTVIGEDGGTFSQGQKQLLCIARVMLTDPAILLLDEATSSIDTRTELQVQAAFDELMAGRTSFVVAHRLSTIRNADCILVMRDGQIIERGTHDELLAADGFYAELYRSQFAQ